MNNPLKFKCICQKELGIETNQGIIKLPKKKLNQWVIYENYIKCVRCKRQYWVPQLPHPDEFEESKLERLLTSEDGA